MKKILLKIKQYSSQILIALVIITVLLVIFFNSYNTNNVKVVCEFLPDFENYDETLTFVYKNGEISKYYRDEVFTATEEKTIDDIYTSMKALTDDVNQSDDYKYTAKLSNDKVYVNTYIDVTKYSEAFYSYAGGLGIESSKTPDELVELLQSTNYSCTIK